MTTLDNHNRPFPTPPNTSASSPLLANRARHLTPPRSHSLPNLIDGVWPSHWSSLPPQQFVDYLHHPWTLDELFNSWKLVTKLKNSYLKAGGRGERLEYLTWRIWIQRTRLLPKLHPHAIKWEKDTSHLNAPGPLFRKIVSVIPTDILSSPGTTTTHSSLTNSPTLVPTADDRPISPPPVTPGCLKRQTMRDFLMRPLQLMEPPSQDRHTMYETPNHVDTPTPDTILVCTSTAADARKASRLVPQAVVRFNHVIEERVYSGSTNVTSSRKRRSLVVAVLDPEAAPVDTWLQANSPVSPAKLEYELNEFHQYTSPLTQLLADSQRSSPLGPTISSLVHALLSPEDSADVDEAYEPAPLESARLRRTCGNDECARLAQGLNYYESASVLNRGLVDSPRSLAGKNHYSPATHAQITSVRTSNHNSGSHRLGTAEPSYPVHELHNMYPPKAQSDNIGQGWYQPTTSSFDLLIDSGPPEISTCGASAIANTCQSLDVGDGKEWVSGNSNFVDTFTTGHSRRHWITSTLDYLMDWVIDTVAVPST